MCRAHCSQAQISHLPFLVLQELDENGWECFGTLNVLRRSLHPPPVGAVRVKGVLQLVLLATFLTKPGKWCFQDREMV